MERRKANLSLSGTTAEFRERLQAFRASESEKEKMPVKAEVAASSQTASVNRLPALVYEDIDVGPRALDEDAAEVCEVGLNKVLEKEGLTVLGVGSRKLRPMGKGTQS